MAFLTSPHATYPRRVTASPTRVVLVTGKGGSGRTTLAAALAVRAARAGARTLLLAPGPATSVTEVLGTPVGPAPTVVEGSLSALRVDARARPESAWAPVSQRLAAGFTDLQGPGPEVASGEEETVSSTAGPPPGVTPRRSDRSPWNWLLVVPIVVPLLVPLYNSVEPTLFGWPRFYWLQLAFVALGVLSTVVVYRMTRRSPAERQAARDAITRDQEG